MKEIGRKQRHVDTVHERLHCLLVQFLSDSNFSESIMERAEVAACWYSKREVALPYCPTMY